MTALAGVVKCGGLLAPLAPSRSVSSDAEKVQERIGEICDHFWEPFSLRHVAETAFMELINVAKEAISPNWDGCGARPIDARAFAQAIAFLNALPTTTKVPEISVDPDGEVSVSWDERSDWIFSVSIGPTGRLSYAGKFGDSKAHGTEWFFDEIPKGVLDNIARLSSAMALQPV